MTEDERRTARLLFAPDLVGTSDELAGRLRAHAAFREVDEVAFALPFTFEHEDYVQILTDMATGLGIVLGTAIMAVALGPGIFFLFYRRYQQVYRCPRPPEEVDG